MEDINQRIQEFYNTIHYTVEPDTGLSNGDTITVKAQYDEALAQQYHSNRKTPSRKSWWKACQPL